MRTFLAFAVIGLLAIGFIACQGKIDESVSELCDRKCLEGFMDQYLGAMVAQDKSMAPFSESFRHTENAKEIPVVEASEGLWANPVSLGDYKFYIADPEAGQIAYVGLVSENEKPALLSMRIKVEKGQITEAEAIVVREMRENNLWTLKTPPAEFTRDLSSEEQLPREELARFADYYFDSIEQIDGSIVPWHDECYRLENGMWTAGQKLPDEIAANMPEMPASKKKRPTGGEGSIAFGRGACTEAIDSGVFALIESIRPRHTPVVDVERGVTWGVYIFNHPGVETVTMPDGTIQPAAYFAGQPNSMPMSELFKIKEGKVRDIMAIGVINEYMSGSGWE
jgi:hypothetical protein